MTDSIASVSHRYMALEPFIVADRRHIPVAVVRKQALRWASAVLKASELPSAASDFEGLTILVTDSVPGPFYWLCRVEGGVTLQVARR